MLQTCTQRHKRMYNMRHWPQEGRRGPSTKGKVGAAQGETSMSFDFQVVSETLCVPAQRSSGAALH